jgi:Ca2+-binding RTX toxin-like protein
MVKLTGTMASDVLIGRSQDDVIFGLQGDDLLDGDIGKDKLVGGIGDDDLYGGEGNDILEGGSGYDFLVGGDGVDVLDGGTTLDEGYPDDRDDFDTVSYLNEGGSSGVKVNLSKQTATDSYGRTDTLIDIERVFGTGFRDVLIGGKKVNDGFESFTGFDGDDSINGLSGFDLVDYYFDYDEGGVGGIIVNLQGETARDGFGATDILLNVESIRATRLSDVLIGSYGDDVFAPFGGNDYIDGSLGIDLVSYSIDVFRGGDRGILADLAQGTIFDCTGSIDTVKGIERVAGSDWDDRILGDEGDNLLDGNEADDVVKGRHGNDELYGGNGSDTVMGGLGNDFLMGNSGKDWLRGGDGEDYFKVNKDSDVETISDFKTGIDTLDVRDFGFTSVSQVLAKLTIVSSGLAVLDLGNDTIVEFITNTNNTVIASGDIII